MKLEVFDSSKEALRAVSDHLVKAIEESRLKPFHLALSGGDTAQLLFKVWTEEYREKIDWDVIRFYWVDERCVSPEDEQSNYKHAEELLFRPLDISPEHVFRIYGEADPELEAGRYAEILKWELPGYSRMPRFDCIILGFGNDGHTASIFPNRMELLTDSRPYAVSAHPETGQKRITMTGGLILRGKTILIPVVGLAKTDMLRYVLAHNEETPAGYILAHAPQATLFTNVKLE